MLCPSAPPSARPAIRQRARDQIARIRRPRDKTSVPRWLRNRGLIDSEHATFWRIGPYADQGMLVCGVIQRLLRKDARQPGTPRTFGHHSTPLTAGCDPPIWLCLLVRYEETHLLFSPYYYGELIRSSFASSPKRRNRPGFIPGFVSFPFTR